MGGKRKLISIKSCDSEKRSANQLYRGEKLFKQYFPDDCALREGTLEWTIRHSLFQMHSQAFRSHTLPLNMVLNGADRMEILARMAGNGSCLLFRATVGCDNSVACSSNPVSSLVNFFTAFHSVYASIVTMKVSYVSVESQPVIPSSSFPGFVKSRVNQPSAPFCLLVPLHDDVILRVCDRTVMRGQAKTFGDLCLQSKAYFMRGDFTYAVHGQNDVLVVKFGTAEYSDAEELSIIDIEVK